MKFRSCEPSFPGSGRLAFGPPEPANFFASKTNMAMLAAGSGVIALFMAAKAGREIVANENVKCFQSGKEPESSGKKKMDLDAKVVDKPILYDPVLSCIFRGGFNQHMVHSAALLAVPYVAPQPALTTSLLVAGIMIYCGTQYYKAFNREPDCCDGALVLGTITLLGGWLSFLI